MLKFNINNINNINNKNDLSNEIQTLRIEHASIIHVKNFGRKILKKGWNVLNV